ncbi:MAG: hypothetical protein ACLR76_04320 [Alistipes sp.]
MRRTAYGLKLNEMTEGSRSRMTTELRAVRGRDDVANMYCLNNMNDWNSIATTGSADGMRMAFEPARRAIC